MNQAHANAGVVHTVRAPNGRFELQYFTHLVDPTKQDGRTTEHDGQATQPVTGGETRGPNAKQTEVGKKRRGVKGFSARLTILNVVINGNGMLKPKPSHYRNQNSGDGSWYGFFGDIYSGVAVGIGHSKWFFLDAIDKARKRIASLSGFENDTSINNENDINIAEGLKVVGVGYGRTGTYSLALALDELGFRTLHTQHLYENHELFDHFVEEIFHKSIRSDDVIMGRPDFDLVLKSGYVATMDLPFALYFDQIHERYPNCKFILTVRENSEVWFKSWNVLTQSISKPARYTRFLASHAKKLGYYMRWLFSVVNNDKRFLSHPFPLPPQSKPDSIASYERHNQLVRDTLPRSHLLEYNVRQGWEPLCQFLDISAADCPTDVPFPKSNSALAVQWQSYSSFLIFWVLFIALCLTIKIVFFRVMGITVIGWFRVQRQKRREQRSKKSR